MSEVAVAETEVQAQPASEATETPVSETVVEQPSAEAQADGTGTDARDTGDGEKEEPEASTPAVPVDPLKRYQELRAKIGKVTLSPEEGRELQSLDDHFQHEKKRLDDLRQKAQFNAERLKNSHTNFYQRITNIPEQATDGSYRASSDIERDRVDAIRDYIAEQKDLHEWPIHDDLNNRLRNVGFTTARHEEWMQQATVSEKVDELLKWGAKAPDGYRLVSEKEIKALTDKAARDAVDGKKVNGVGATTIDTTGLGSGAGPGGMTAERYHAMEASERMTWEKEHPAEFGAFIASESRRRAVRA